MAPCPAAHWVHQDLELGGLGPYLSDFAEMKYFRRSGTCVGVFGRVCVCVGGLTCYTRDVT